MKIIQYIYLEYKEHLRGGNESQEALGSYSRGRPSKQTILVKTNVMRAAVGHPKHSLKLDVEAQNGSSPL